MLKNLKVGDKAWLVQTGKFGEEVEITKTGSKYLYFLTQFRADKKTGDVQIYYKDGTSWPNQGRLFKSDADAKETVEAEARWYDLVSDLKFVKKSFKMNVKKVNKVREILGLEEGEG